LAKTDAEQAEWATATLEAYRANSRNTLASNIDWTKLALGTDYFGTN
jgi:hypothetical protein